MEENLSREPIHYFHSERNTEHNNGFYNPSKFYLRIVEGITSKDLANISIDDGKIYNNVGNLLSIMDEDIDRFQKGELKSLIFDWDGIYDTSYYIRESALSDDERAMIQNTSKEND